MSIGTQSNDIACMESGVKKTMCIDREKKCDVYMDTDHVACMDTGVKKTVH